MKPGCHEMTHNPTSSNSKSKFFKVFGAYAQDYQHRDLPQQYCFVLHIQLLVKEDIIAQTSKPTGLVFGPGVAQRQQQQQQQQQQQPQQQPFNFNNGWGSPGTTYGRPTNRRRQR